MSDFDPYHKWLGISPQYQPPNHYRLLSLDLYESDPDVIEASVDRIAAFLQDVATGPHAKESQKLLNEIAAARLCLLDDASRMAYDEHLTAELSPPIQTPGANKIPASAVPTFAIDTGASSAAKATDRKKTTKKRPATANSAKLATASSPGKSQKSGEKKTSQMLLLSFVSGGGLLVAASIYALLTGGDSDTKRRAAEEARIRERHESFARMGREAESNLPDFEPNYEANINPQPKKERRHK
ncbi:MAG: hypothetical protein CMJ64_20435 [Planctomycetaceae bacterium]|nr:hypothetical protein [Planctomycetaceae bacterium]